MTNHINSLPYDIEAVRKDSRSCRAPFMASHWFILITAHRRKSLKS